MSTEYTHSHTHSHSHNYMHSSLTACVRLILTWSSKVEEVAAFPLEVTEFSSLCYCEIVSKCLPSFSEAPMVLIQHWKNRLNIYLDVGTHIM